MSSVPEDVALVATTVFSERGGMQSDSETFERVARYVEITTVDLTTKAFMRPNIGLVGLVM